MKIGDFDAWDYLGDGSVYVLNVPGHATAHVSALVRPTADTFVLMGGGKSSQAPRLLFLILIDFRRLPLYR